MAKIRPVHPDIWTDDDFVSVTPWARLLFIGLWNFACDNGHIEDRSRQIKRRVLPFDDINVADLLRELESTTEPLIHRDGEWIVIPGAATRWRLDLRYWKGCSKPGCVKPKRETRRGHDGDTTGTRSDHVADGDGDGETAAAAEVPPLTLDPMLAGLQAAMHRYTKLRHIRFDATPADKVAEIRDLIALHGDERLVEVALKAPEDVAHVGWFVKGWQALPAPGQRLKAVEQKFCTTHPWQRLSPSGACSLCASERLAEGANA